MDKQQKWISIIYGLLPAINVYSIYEDKITFGHAIMLLTLIMSLPKAIKTKNKSIWISYLLLVVYSVVSTILVCATHNYEFTKPLIRIVLLVFYFVSAFVLVEGTVINPIVFRKTYVIMAIAAAFGVLLHQ